MPVPRVAIVGRPNVGKSSIFNWLAGKRLAIVDDQPGVTRDRMTTLIEHNDRFFELIDTGGMGIEDVDNLTKDVEHQITLAIEDADVLLFVVDTKTGLVPLDEHVAERLRKVEKPVLLLANKTDHPGLDNATHDFHRLGEVGWSRSAFCRIATKRHCSTRSSNACLNASTTKAKRKHRE